MGPDTLAVTEDNKRFKVLLNTILRLGAYSFFTY